MVLGQPGQLREWSKLEHGVGSGLVEAECLRSIDRLRVRGVLTFEESVVRREAVYRLLEAFERVDVTPAILERASQPMPSPLGTLDAIHLATADLWRAVHQKPLLFATHDQALALAARASGFRVVGLAS